MRRESFMPGPRIRLRALVRSEEGFSVPVTLIMIIVGLGLASAAIMASIAAQSGSVRDEQSKDSLAAADAAAQLAVYRQDKIVTTDLAKCVVPQSGALVANGTLGADGWCPAVQSTTADGLPAGTSFTYRVQPWTVVGTTQTGVKRQLQIVAVGTSGGVSRRIDVTASAKTGQGVFAGNGAIGQDKVTISGAAQVGTTANTTNVGTGGDVLLSSSKPLCGNAYHGVGHSLQTSGSASQCPGYGSYDTQVSLPAVDPGDSWTNNSDSRICVLDPGPPGNQCSTTGNTSKAVSWDPNTRALALKGNATLSLGGTVPYSLCSLDMQAGSKLIVSNTAGVTIYFGSPEQCRAIGNQLSLQTPALQLSMQGNPRLSSTNQDPGALKLLFVGSDTIPSSVSMKGNPSATSSDPNTFTIYGPKTDVTLDGNSTYVGAVAGKTLTVQGSATLMQRDSATNSSIPVVTSFTRERYVECTGGTLPAGAGALPNNSC
jgi:hypothetical protein